MTSTLQLGATLAALLGAAEATATEVETWERLHDALLGEAVDGLTEQVRDDYQLMSQNLSADDPARGLALYWLGRSQYALGQLTEARESLKECIRLGHSRDPCLELLGRMELERESVDEVPVHWAFDDANHGFIHPWRYGHKGSLRIESMAGDPALAWTTKVTPQEDDQLVVGFKQPWPPPDGVRFDVTSTVDSHLRIVIYDVFGRKYTPGPFVVRAGKTQVVNLEFSALAGFDAAQAPLDPTRIDRLVIQDVTAYLSRATGPNTLYFDDFMVY